MASSSRTPARRTGGNGRRSDSWSWWDEVNADRPSGGGGSRPWSCKLCPYRRTSGANKVRAHLLHESGHEVQFCTNVSQEKRRELLARVGTQESYLSSRPKRVAIDPTTFVTPMSSEGSRAGPSTSPGNLFSFMSSAVPTAPPATASRPRQSTLHGSWDPKKKEETDAAVARFFYHDYIPFNAARSEYFKVMVKKIGEYGPNYVAPSYESLRTTLLDKEKRIVERATEVTKQHWETYGVTLIADGWSDTRKRSIHGLVAYSRGEMYFVEAHDASDIGKSAEALAGEWTSAIEIIGPQNVVSFVVDGEASNRAAGAIIERRYPHIFVSFCMAHCLNNLLKDISKLEWIEPVIQTANQIVSYILNHQYLRHQYSLRASKQLLKYSDTRFAYNFLMLGRLRDQMAAVKQLFISDEFTKSPLARTTTGVACKAMSENASFWDDVEMIDTLVAPIIHLLRLVDGMKPCIGKVYEAMDRMIEKLKGLVENDAKYEELHELCVSRWDEYASPLHAAAYVLDPEFQGRKQEEDKEVSSHWRHVLSRMVPDAERRQDIRDQLSKYRDCQGTFGLADAQEDRKRVAGSRWWDDWGISQEFKNNALQALARRILSQAVSSSCLEQLWSSLNHIASKKRNRLGVEKANDLLFVSANLRMLSKGFTKELDSFTEWEMEQDAQFTSSGQPHGATTQLPTQSTTSDWEAEATHMASCPGFDTCVNDAVDLDTDDES